MAELQGDGIFLWQYHRRFSHYFQDLLSKVDIHEDIWGPGHGVKNLTGNTQLALTSRGPHQMSFHIISSLGVWEAYISQIFSSDQELRKSLSSSMDGSVIFVNSSPNLHAVSQLPLSCLSPASDSCLSAVFQLSLTRLSELSQHSLWVREKYSGITFNRLTSLHWSLRLWKPANIALSWCQDWAETEPGLMYDHQRSAH